MAVFDAAPRGVRLNHDAVRRYRPHDLEALGSAKTAPVDAYVDTVHGQKRLRLLRGARERVHHPAVAALIPR